MSRRRKGELLQLLRSPDFHDHVEDLWGLSARRVINPLFSALSSLDPQIKWRSVKASGVAVSRLAAEDMEAARNIVRRLIWSLNDESGGIGWGAPEALGEILARHEGLAEEYAPILVSYVREDGNYLANESLQRGVVWGLGRLAQVRKELLRSLDLPRHLRPHLRSKDGTTRGLTAWALGWLGDEECRSGLEDLLGDETEVGVHLDGRLVRSSVHELAAKALRLIQKKAGGDTVGGQ